MAGNSSTCVEAASRSLISDAAGSFSDDIISIVCCSSLMVRSLQDADVLFVISTDGTAACIKDVLSMDEDAGVGLSIDVLNIRYP